MKNEDFPEIHCSNCGELLLCQNFNWHNGCTDDGVVEEAWAEIKCHKCRKIYTVCYAKRRDKIEAIEAIKKSIEQ